MADATRARAPDPPAEPEIIAIAEAIGVMLARRDHAEEQRRKRNIEREEPAAP